MVEEIYLNINKVAPTAIGKTPNAKQNYKFISRLVGPFHYFFFSFWVKFSNNNLYEYARDLNRAAVHQLQQFKLTRIYLLFTHAYKYLKTK